MSQRSRQARKVRLARNGLARAAVGAVAHSEAEMDHWMRSGEVLFGIEIPSGFERGVRRGDRPALLLAADATDPVASGTALAALEGIIGTAFARDRGLPEITQASAPFEIRQHRRYNPAAVTSLNVVIDLGYTLSTIAQNQLQAIQKSFMFFLPNILLSGFMFPFAGMPRWAQWFGEVLPAHAFHPHCARHYAQERDGL
jgi:ABC-2 type transporter